MTQDEARLYQKGYATGRKRARVDAQRELEAAEREQFKRQVFLAILPELVRSPWQTGGKSWTTTEQFVDGAWRFARAASYGSAFNGMTLAASATEAQRAETGTGSVHDGAAPTADAQGEQP